MDEYIERRALLADYDAAHKGKPGGARKLIEDAPAADVVSRVVHKQVQEERDVAIAQLASYGVSLGEKAELAPVKHGRWEKEQPYISVGGEYKKALICSQCHSFFVSDGNKPWQMHNYCPNCGAKMDLED